jgi:hypothetical protein
LTPEQLVQVRQFVVEQRTKAPIAIIDAYYDGEGKALCPMATGISHHVGPGGDIEPCPIIQFATETIRDPRGLFETMRDSEFLRDFRQLSARHTRGCVILERPDLVRELVVKHGARDTTQRSDFNAYQNVAHDAAGKARQLRARLAGRPVTPQL